MPFPLELLLTTVIGFLLASSSHAKADALPQVTATGLYTGAIGAVTPTPLSASLYDSTFGSNYWPYVATDASGQNTLIPTAFISSATFVAQTTNAGNPINVSNQPTSASQSATSAPMSLRSSQTISTASTTMVIQTGNMAADRYGSTVGLGRPAAMVIGAAVIIGGAMI